MVAGRAALPGDRRTGEMNGVGSEGNNAPAGNARLGSPLEVFRVFLKLGVSSFGGPIAHIGYYREEFVVRRRWLDEEAFVDLVALCQFLPGPASSQVGFSIGLMRAGYAGAAAAWTGFTLPSAIIMVLFAYGAGALRGPIGAGLLHGLKLVAVAIVAQAVWGMARTLCPDRERASIAVLSALVILFSSSSVAQIGAILLGGILGLWLCRGAPPTAKGQIAMAGLAPRGAGGADGIFCSAGWATYLADVAKLAGRRAFRRLLPLRRAGLRWRPCRAAVIARGVRRARLGQRRCISGRLRRGTGGSGAALHLRRLSRCRGQAVATRHSRSGAGALRHFSSRVSHSSRRTAILG